MATAKKTKTITCNSCGKSVTVGLTKGCLWGKWDTVWDIPKGWSVTIPPGWLCPKCSKA